MEPAAPLDRLPSPILPGEGEDRVLRILESITDGFCAFDAQWRFTYFNEAGLRLLASHLEDPSWLLGKVIWEALPETRGSGLEREFRRAVESGLAVEVEYFHPPWRALYAVRAFPIRGGGLSVYFRDVTAERATAQTLRQGEERYRSLFNSIDEGFAVIEILWEGTRAVDYRFVEVNPAFAKQTGLRDAVGHTAREIIPNLEEHWFEAYGRVASTGQASRFVLDSAAMQRWFDVYAFPHGPAGRGLVALLFTDITARRRAESEVARLGLLEQARVAELEALLEVLPVGIGIALDRTCQTVRFNPAFVEVLGLAPGMAGKEQPASFRVLDDLGHEIPPEQLPLQIAAREGRELRDVEVNVLHADGRLVRLLEYAAPLFDEHRQPRGSVGAFVNITERRRLEQRQHFLLQLDDAVRPLSDPKAIVAAAARLLGEHLGVDRCAYADIEADQDTMNIIGDFCRDVPSIVGRYTFTQFGSEVLRLMRADAPFVVQDIETHQPPPEDRASYEATQIRAVICVPLHKTGRFAAALAVHQKTPRRWREEEIVLVRDVANRCWEALERAKVARVLAESEERFRALADNIAQLAWMADPQGVVFWYNRRWLEYTGSAHVAREPGWPGVLHPEHAERVAEKFHRHLLSGEIWEDTFPLRGADGQYRWFLSRAVPIRDGEGEVLRWFGTNTDVTEQRAVAEALAAAKEQAEAASRAKDDFLAALSHELRTPLTPVLLSAAALQDDARLPEDVRVQLAMMRRNIELEARLIDDLLDVTRIARGKLALRVQDCEAHSLLGLALEIVRDEARAKAQRLEVQLIAQQTHFLGDPARVQQVFWNLLKNAVKFTPQGGQIFVRSVDRAGGLIVEVSDTGIGLEPDAAERIFLPFEQGNPAGAHRFGGLGLGLSISKAIVEMHGGEIFAESAGPDQGATFRVDLPAIERPLAVVPETAEGSAQPEAAAASAEAPLRILLVEDHEPTLAVLARLLTRAGHTVATANSVAAARELAARESFDTVISDVGLPDGTGIELMESLRNAYGLHGIAVTGYGMEEDLRRSREAGFLAHLTKPVDFAQLRRALRTVTPGR